jgi:FtsZ-binding cell division protein ZapB
MTDNNEIIKALEDIRYHLTASKHKQIVDDAIETINRQQAEIEQYKDYNAKWMEKHEEARSEAIEEFAERLKDEATTVGVDEMYDGQPMYVSVECINKVKKEMVGGKISEGRIARCR